MKAQRGADVAWMISVLLNRDVESDPGSNLPLNSADDPIIL
jgi:hypothetical protein